jgi:iron complex outermembrane receptor protein
MQGRAKLVCGVSAGVLLAGLGSVAQAADPATPSASSTQLEELIVTAERRAETSQKVPISITVIGADALREHIRTSGEVAQMVPNIQLGAPIGFGTPRTGIRGVSQSDFNPNATTSNMLYFDDVPLDAPIAQGSPIWDLERVEVLRGPQGTLFGRNATGGAVRYISAMPKNEAEGYVEVGYGAHDLKESRGAYGGPITDTLKARFSYTYRDFGGDINNVVLQTKQGKQKYAGFRGILDWQPTEQLRVVLRAQHLNGDQDVLEWKISPGLSNLPTNFGPLINYPSLAALQAAYGFKNLGQSSNYYISESDVPVTEHIEHTPISLNIDYNLGFATLTSVSGFLNVDQYLIYDDDSTPAPILTEYDRSFAQQWSQEFRLTSPDQGRFKWIAGAFYMQEKIKADQDLDVTAWLTNVAGSGFEGSKTVDIAHGTLTQVRTWAAFLHTTYDITSDLKLTAAVRYTDERRQLDYNFNSFWDFPTAVPGTSREVFDFIRAVNTGNRGALIFAEDPAHASGAKSWSNVSWKVGLDYNLGQLGMVYGLVSRGFKGGALPPGANALGDILTPDGSKIVTVEPEIVTDYEVGFKGDVVPGKLRFNASAFYYDYKNFQTNQLFPQLSIQILSNLPKAELYGVEAEITAKPIEHLTIDLGLGAVHTRITKADDPSLTGHKLPLAEDFNWNALVRYDIPTSIGTFSPEVSAKHTGSYYSSKENALELGDFTLINARIGYESPDGKYYAALWATNLGDVIRPIAVDDPSEFFGSTLSNVNEHRRYGLTVGARF